MARRRKLWVGTSNPAGISSLGIFARYSEWDNEAGSAQDTVKEQWDTGINFYLHPQVVLKADYSNYGGVLDGDAFHLGVGYAF